MAVLVYSTARMAIVLVHDSVVENPLAAIMIPLSIIHAHLLSGVLH